MNVASVCQILGGLVEQPSLLPTLRPLQLQDDALPADWWPG